MKQIQTQTTIQTTPGAIWKAITDFAGHRHWNTYLPEWTGKAKVGEHLQYTDYSAGKPMQVAATVTEVVEDRKLRYVRTMLAPWFFRADHSIEVRPIQPGKCLLIQTEQYSGIMAPIIGGRMAKNTQEGLERMNADLKKYLEDMSLAPSS